MAREQISIHMRGSIYERGSSLSQLPLIKMVLADRRLSLRKTVGQSVAESAVYISNPMAHTLGEIHLRNGV
jgi:hypothetical protein